MDNIKLWLDDDGYIDYLTSDNYTEPYVGYVPASSDYIRGMQGTPAITFFNASSSQKSHDDACAGDIVYANDNGNKMYAPYQYDAYWQAKGWKAIAAVVVPARYTPDGTIRAMSLVNMDCANFDQGGITGPKKDVSNNTNTNGQSCLCWGPTGSTVDTPYDDIGQLNSQMPLAKNLGYLPRDHKYNASISGNSDDVDAWWWYGATSAPSPYGNQSAYSKEGQVLADMDGRGHTDAALKHVPASAFTMTNGLSPNSEQTGDTEIFNVPKNYPPFTLCARYKTTGTESATTDSSGYKSLGSWYLPSAGELGYLIVRQGLIFNACENVRVDGAQHSGYGIWLARYYISPLDESTIGHSAVRGGRPGAACWSSSESDKNQAWYCNFTNGSVSHPIATIGNQTEDKTSRLGWERVRAFAAF